MRSPKDGYTLLVATSSSTIRERRTPPIRFDFATDLAPIALVANVPFVLTAYPGLGVKTRAGVRRARQGQAGGPHLRRHPGRDHRRSRRRSCSTSAPAPSS